MERCNSNKEITTAHVKKFIRSQSHTIKKRKRNDMTIKIEREAVLYVLSRPASTGYQSHYDTSRLQPYDDEAEIVVNPSKEDAVILVPISPSRYNDKRALRVETVPEPTCKNTNDDCVRESPTGPDRRVSFAQPVVTDVWTRPRTLPEDLRALFYTCEETQR